MTIGKNIMNKRKELGLTQKTLAENLNVSDKTISSWVNERTYPDIEMLIQLSDYLSLSLDELIKEDIEMVKNIDENVKDGKKWKKWNKLIIIAFVLLLVLLFITSQVKFA
ncbi:helix-turn-helix domain-containing protein [Miniphocaeibacter halophilus]|uniref:Helix-turn-helix transcriptional regulator n=1 Tax=Miniphocaeibacter halophilus TaxID=2931922 RepID=A0AC61MRN0_9FIRM|nr:helix-turn-helix transcriptional regulator [Miniphocaeibacter halophilus]QQK08244.1 helix-turn-helix transcriptional regulator [Miniphocaeibacter halophilus]